jgi:hypothetical protein
MYALSDATVRRLVILSREAGFPEVPELSLEQLDPRAIHFALRVGPHLEDLPIDELSLSLRLRDRRATYGVRIHISGKDQLDVLVPTSFLLEDLAAREMAAWPAPQDVLLRDGTEDPVLGLVSGPRLEPA